MCAWKIKENKNTFLINLVNPWRIVLAFELNQDIYTPTDSNVITCWVHKKEIVNSSYLHSIMQNLNI